MENPENNLVESYETTITFISDDSLDVHAKPAPILENAVFETFTEQNIQLKDYAPRRKYTDAILCLSGVGASFLVGFLTVLCSSVIEISVEIVRIVLGAITGVILIVIVVLCIRQKDMKINFDNAFFAIHVSQKCSSYKMLVLPNNISKLSIDCRKCNSDSASEA